MLRKVLYALPLGLVLSTVATTAYAQEVTTGELAYAIDNMVLLVCTVLVFFMQAGFSMLEAGFNSAKNVLNIMFKNATDVSIGLVIFWLVGYGLMYGDAVVPGFLAWGGIGISEVAPEPGAGVLNPQIDWLFQAVFAATAATIVSGAVAGRIKISAYLIYTVVMCAVIYPISGYWKWGGGWLDAMGFHDFAGSLLVHSVGGFAALAAVMVLGPRIGRFGPNSKGFAPHSYPLAALGTFILWMGWYGFNPGSQLAFAGAANTDATVAIAVNTTLAAATGSLVAMLIAWFMTGRPDLGYTLNGALGGLVGITANADIVSNGSALIIGIISGIIIVGATLLLERLKIDDAVGAWPVHGACGIWGGLAAAIFGGAPFGAQIIGSIVVPVWAFVMAFILFSILKAVNLLRVGPEEETEGLDISEHGASAYVSDTVFAR
jgi:Amt family ammonium transporter